MPQVQMQLLDSVERGKTTVTQTRLVKLAVYHDLQSFLNIWQLATPINKMHHNTASTKGTHAHTSSQRLLAPMSLFRGLFFLLCNEYVNVLDTRKQFFI